MTNQTPESRIDDSVVEAAYRAFCEARIGKTLSDDEHDALRSRLELTWIKPTIAAAFRAANMLREPGGLAAHDAEVAAKTLDRMALTLETPRFISSYNQEPPMQRMTNAEIVNALRDRAAEYRKAVQDD